MEDHITEANQRLEFEFEQGAISDEEAGAWFNEILGLLPMGATGKMFRKPQIVDVDELGPEHEGYRIVIKRGDESKSIYGKLEQVYPIAHKDYGRILIVDGRAHEVAPYEVATLEDGE